ncbi:hypothetical protein BC830DRAFT_1168640 [Chytriomyces sp. MP71]|nr:hypothetical protein BC830DRAFT_1168640 [Chytriomyces sp. MP71]
MLRKSSTWLAPAWTPADSNDNTSTTSPTISRTKSKMTKMLNTLSPFLNLMLPLSRATTPEPSPSVSPNLSHQALAVPATEGKTKASTEYVVACLEGEDQIPGFLDHLDTVFHVPKPNGSFGASRALFLDHWELDPARDYKGCFVATCGEDKKIVSSVRVYNRHIHLGLGAAHGTGGIGDVATNIAHRGKSLAKRLMKLSDEYISSKYDFGILHAAPLAAPIYASIGWREVNMKSLTIRTDLETIQEATAATTGSVRDIVFETSHPDLALIKALFSLTAASILGSFARTDDFYWLNYVATSHDSRRNVVRLLYSSTDTITLGTCVGYAICEVLYFDINNAVASITRASKTFTPTPPSAPVQAEAINIQIKEIFAGKVSRLDSATGHVQEVVAQNPAELATTLSHLIHDAVQQLLLPLPDSARDAQRLNINVPSAFLPADAVKAMDASWMRDTQKCDDAGWMFKVFRPFKVTRMGDAAPVEIATEEDFEFLFGPVGSAGATPVGTPFAMCEGVKLSAGTDVFGFLKTDAF